MGKIDGVEGSQAVKRKDSIWRHARIGVPKYSTPNELWDDALRYFEWCDNNPVDGSVIVTRYKKEKRGGHKELKMQDMQNNVDRPYTIFGLCAFTGITDWPNFKIYNMEREGFRDVIRTIENVIASQQIDGALTGLFRENLASRLNGIAERVVADYDVNLTSEQKFTGFSFLPHTDGLPNSEQTKIASGEVIEKLPEPEPVYAEIIDAEEINGNENKREAEGSV